MLCQRYMHTRHCCRMLSYHLVCATETVSKSYWSRKIWHEMICLLTVCVELQTLLFAVAALNSKGSHVLFQKFMYACSIWCTFWAIECILFKRATASNGTVASARLMQATTPQTTIARVFAFLWKLDNKLSVVFQSFYALDLKIQMEIDLRSARE